MNNTSTIVIGGGCFWCTESVFKSIKGIINVECAYAGGKIPNPSYEQICSGNTGHAEVVKIEFEPKVTSLYEILLIFMATHNPMTLNQQGGDIGTQYRSVIFYKDEQQHKVALNLIEELKPHFPEEIVTELSPLNNYYKAEEKHQDYYSKNPDQAYCNAVIPPKLEKLKKLFADKMK